MGIAWEAIGYLDGHEVFVSMIRNQGEDKTKRVSSVYVCLPVPRKPTDRRYAGVLHSDLSLDIVHLLSPEKPTDGAEPCRLRPIAAKVSPDTSLR